jgi:hypothetical protein
MADFRDVIHARHDADAALGEIYTLGGTLEDGRTLPAGLDVLLSARAICLELRALALTIDCSLSARAGRDG